MNVGKIYFSSNFVFNHCNPIGKANDQIHVESGQERGMSVSKYLHVQYFMNEIEFHC